MFSCASELPVFARVIPVVAERIVLVVFVALKLPSEVVG